MKNITTAFSGHGHYKITAIIRGKQRSAITNNMPAIDRYNDTDMQPKAKDGRGYTRAQAAQSLYDEIKIVNGL